MANIAMGEYDPNGYLEVLERELPEFQIPRDPQYGQFGGPLRVERWDMAQPDAPMDGGQANQPAAPAAPSGGGGYSVDWIRNWMKSRGVSDHVINDEANDNLLRYGNDLPGVLESTLPSWLTRSNRPTQSAGGIGGSDDVNQNGRRDVLEPQMAGGGIGQYSTGGGGYSTASNSFTTPFQDDMRKILMEQLGMLGKAPTVNDLGIAENLAGRRLALQRSAERQRAANAETLAGGGLASSGAAQTGRLGIEQARGEAEARGIGDVLGGELQGRRQQLANLLNMALATGDAEAARIIQKQMQDDQLAYMYTQLQQQGNSDALMALLGAL